MGQVIVPKRSFSSLTLSTLEKRRVRKTIRLPVTRLMGNGSAVAAQERPGLLSQQIHEGRLLRSRET